MEICAHVCGKQGGWLACMRIKKASSVHEINITHSPVQIHTVNSSHANHELLAFKNLIERVVGNRCADGWRSIHGGQGPTMDSIQDEEEEVTFLWLIF